MTGRLGMALEKPYVAKQVVGAWFHQFRADISEPSFKKMKFQTL